MSRGHKKTGRGQKSLEYYLKKIRDMSDAKLISAEDARILGEKLIAQYHGVWTDVSGIFAKYGIKDGGSMRHVRDIERMTVGKNGEQILEVHKEYDLELLARGVSPVHGSLDPKLMVKKVFQHASTDEKVKIRKLFTKAGVVMAADVGPDEILHVLNNGNDPRNSEVVAAVFKAAGVVTAIDLTLVRNAGYERQTGSDNPLAVDKRISMLWAMSPAEDQKVFEEIFVASVRDAMIAQDRYATKCRTGAGGQGGQVDSHAAVASFFEHSARPVDLDGDDVPIEMQHLLDNEARTGKRGIVIDPQLHMHVLTLGVAIDNAGTVRALDGRAFLKAQAIVAQTFHASIIDRFQQLGYEFEADEETGKISLAIKGVPELAKEMFSSRSRQMKQQAKELGIDLNGEERIAHATEEMLFRSNRNQHIDGENVTRTDFLERLRERGDVYGWGVEEAAALRAMAAQRVKDGLNVPENKLTLSDYEELIDAAIYLDSVIDEPRLRAAALGAFAGLATPAEIDAMTTLAFEKYCVVLDDAKDFKVLSTAKQQAIEQASKTITLTAKHTPHYTKADIETGIRNVNEPRKTEGRGATDEQVSAVWKMCDTEQAVTFLQAPAGSGKSYLLSMIREIYKTAGYELTGAALSWEASNTLKHEGQLDSASAIEGFIRKLENGTIRLHSRSVVVLDEMSLIGSRHYHAIVRAVEAAGAKLVCAGDFKQIAAVEAGGIARACISLRREQCGNDGIATLSDVRRQEKVWDRVAGLLMADGKTQDAFRLYMFNGASGFDDCKTPEEVQALLDKLETVNPPGNGRFTIESNRDEAIAALFKQYVADRKQFVGDSQIMMAKSNVDVDTLNAMAYQHLKDAGEITQEASINITDRYKKQVAMTFGVGTLIQFGIKSGDLDAMDPKLLKKLIGKDGKKSIDAKKDSVENVFNRTRGIVKHIEGSGSEAKVTLELMAGDKPSGRFVTVSAKDFARKGDKGDPSLPITMAFATTVDGAQGGTYDRAYLAPSGSSGSSLDRARSYVGTSRHRKDCKLFLDRNSVWTEAQAYLEATSYVTRATFSDRMAIETLANQMCREVIKNTTLDWTEQHLREERLSRTLNPMDQAAKKKKVFRDLAKKTTESTTMKEKAWAVVRKVHDHAKAELRIWSGMSQDFVKAKSTRAPDVKNALETAISKFGNKIQITGSSTFHRAVIAASSKINKAIEFMGEKTRAMAAIKRVFGQEIAYGDVKKVVPSGASQADVNQILLDAVKAGHRDIKLTGSKRFREGVFDICSSTGIDVRFVDRASQSILKEMNNVRGPQRVGQLRPAGRPGSRNDTFTADLHAASAAAVAGGTRNLDSKARPQSAIKANAMRNVQTFLVVPGHRHK
jgi:ATP-dependent exoDNAse (exonuclease V) alpha subunit